MFSAPKTQANCFAVSSVLFSHGDSFHQETKTGSYVYRGDAMKFHEWEFCTRARVATKTGDYVEAASKVVEGLRVDAFVVAQEVGLADL
jgi:homoserine acetyltransferase